MDTLSLTKKARMHNGEKTISLTSGAEKTGQPLVKEWRYSIRGFSLKWFGFILQGFDELTKEMVKRERAKDKALRPLNLAVWNLGGMMRIGQ